MATEAVTNNFVMIDCARCDRRPGDRPRLMARGTTISGVNVIAGFAREQCVVMTTDARANDMCMIDIRRRHRYPDVSAVVAGLA